jgi:hypothetical protein
MCPSGAIVYPIEIKIEKTTETTLSVSFRVPPTNVIIIKAKFQLPQA